MQKILSLSEHEASELFDGLVVFPTNSWPIDIQNLFHKFKIGDTDTFKFIFFAVGNNMSPYLLLNFLLIEYWKNLGKIPK